MKSDPLPIQTDNFLLRIGQDTHRGVRNKPNEDRFTIFPSRSSKPGAPPLATIAIVADGVTSSSGGGEAAEIALQVLRQELDGRTDSLGIKQLDDAVQRANRTIVDRAKDNPALHNMTTTVVLAALTGDQLAVAHVGDSRAYLVRGETIYRLTVDHTWVQEALDIGRLTLEAAKTHENRHVIRRCLGLDRWVDVDCKLIQPGSDQGKGVRSLVDTITVQPGDFILLCSDGLTDKISDEELKQIILQQKQRGQSPQKIVHALIQEALQRQEADNITVVLLEAADATAAHSLVWPLRPARMASLVTALILVVAVGLGWRLMAGNGTAAEELPPQAVVATPQPDNGEPNEEPTSENAAVVEPPAETPPEESAPPSPTAATNEVEPEPPLATNVPELTANEAQAEITNQPVSDESTNGASVTDTKIYSGTTEATESAPATETNTPTAETEREEEAAAPPTATTTATATEAATATATGTPTIPPTETLVPTGTPTRLPTSTMVPTSTQLPTSTRTATSPPTPTFTPRPPTATPRPPTATSTPVPPTATPTETPTDIPQDDDDDDGGGGSSQPPGGKP